MALKSNYYTIDAFIVINNYYIHYLFSIVINYCYFHYLLSIVILVIISNYYFHYLFSIIIIIINLEFCKIIKIFKYPC